jgi:Esterase-like activity of phytase
MSGRIWAIAIATGALGIAGAGMLAASSAGAPGSSPQAHELPATGPGSIAIGTDAAGRTWSLGGISALDPIGASGKEFWGITDRGPNDDSDVTRSCNPIQGSPAGKVVFLPSFNPEIDKLGASQDRIKVQERIPLHDGAHAASGLPNLTFDEASYLRAANGSCTATPSTGGVIDPFGVDTEGIRVDPRDGSFWLADEYRPSVMHVGSDGQILSRIVPQNITVAATSTTSALDLNTATQYGNSVTAAGGSFAVQPRFPGIVNGFRKNRGFEGLVLSPDGQTLYTLLQSPMDYRTAWGSSRVTSAQRDAARNGPVIRVFKLDISNASDPVLEAEWIYLLSRGRNLTPATPAAVDRISDVQWLDHDVLLIQERDDGVNPTAFTHYYRADFTNATDVRNNAAANNTTPPTLEMAALPGSITPAAISTAPFFDVDSMLAGAGFINTKLEGGGMLGARGANPAIFAAINDNDFDLERISGSSSTSLPTQLDVFPLP